MYLIAIEADPEFVEPGVSKFGDLFLRTKNTKLGIKIRGPWKELL